MKTEAELIGYGLVGGVKITDSNHLNIALFSLSEIVDEVDEVDEAG
ncbi:hypothetical protein [Microcoleus sp. B3-D7]